MSSLLFTILTPKGVLYEGEVEEAYAPTRQGPLGVLPGHSPLIASLNPKGGLLKVVETSSVNKYFVCYGGAIEVKREKTIVLSEDCLAVSSLEEGENQLKASRNKVVSTSENDIKMAEAKLTSTYSKSQKKDYTSTDGGDERGEKL